MAEKQNLDLWSRVEKTDPSHTKKVTFGRGFTAIDPYYQIKCATEQFGAAGEGWGWEVVRLEEFIKTASIGLLIRLWHGEKENYIEQWGQSSLFTDNAQTKPDHDMLKKATTDGITKCLSYLGFNADVFTGKFDDNKYVAQMNAEFAQKNQFDTAPVNQEKVRNAITAFKKWIDEDSIGENHAKVKNTWTGLSNDEKSAVNKQLTDKAPDSNKLYKSLVSEHIKYKPEL